MAVILERQPQVAAETSWGNAGMIAPGHSFVWSSPRAPMILLKSLVLKDQALRFKLSADPRLYSWSWLFLMECTAEKARRNTLLKHRLAVYSQSVLKEVVAGEAIDYDRNDRGILYFYRSQQALDKGVEHYAAARIRRAADQGARPRGHRRARSGAGLRQGKDRRRHPLPDRRDRRSGEVHPRAGRQAGRARRRDPHRHHHHRPRDVGRRRRPGADRQRPGQGRRLCAGARLLQPADCQDDRAQPADLSNKGYSLTIPIGNRPAPPTIAAIDEHNLVAVSRFGDRLRVTATAEFAGYDTSHKPADFAFMKGVTEELYPEGADYDRAEMWAGLRPMTPNNLPEFGQRRLRNLYLNTGHGHIGWTMSHGSARITADLIAGRKPSVSMEGLLN
ncbi:FAD-dependent oxidoreductase [Mesorhizobium atlanticum]